jgi:hypothetical protein
MISICFEETISEKAKETLIRDDSILENISDKVLNRREYAALVETKTDLVEEDILQGIERLNKLSQVRYSTPVFEISSTRLILLNEFTVRFKPDVTEEDIQILNEKYGVEIVEKLPYSVLVQRETDIVHLRLRECLAFGKEVFLGMREFWLTVVIKCVGRPV